MLRVLLVIAAASASHAQLPSAPSKCSAPIIKSIDWGAGTDSFGVSVLPAAVCFVVTPAVATFTVDIKPSIAADAWFTRQEPRCGAVPAVQDPQPALS